MVALLGVSWSRGRGHSRDSVNIPRWQIYLEADPTNPQTQPVQGQRSQLKQRKHQRRIGNHINREGWRLDRLVLMSEKRKAMRCYFLLLLSKIEQMEGMGKVFWWTLAFKLHLLLVTKLTWVHTQKRLISDDD